MLAWERKSLLVSHQQYFRRAGGVLTDCTHSCVSSALFILFYSEYACVRRTLRCVLKTARQVKTSSTFKNASRERPNATSCVNAGVMPHCHSLSDRIYTHTHTIGHCGGSNTLTRSVQFGKAWTLHTWNHWSDPMPRNQSRRAYDVSRSCVCSPR